MGGFKQKVWYPLSHVSHTSILESFPGFLQGTWYSTESFPFTSFLTLTCTLKGIPPALFTLTCRLGTLCIQGTANQHVCGQSEQCLSRPHDSDAHSWYRRTCYTTPQAPHILHSEPPLQWEGIDITD